MSALKLLILPVLAASALALTACGGSGTATPPAKAAPKPEAPKNVGTRTLTTCGNRGDEDVEVYVSTLGATSCDLAWQTVVEASKLLANTGRWPGFVHVRSPLTHRGYDLWQDPKQVHGDMSKGSVTYRGVSDRDKFSVTILYTAHTS